MLVRNISLITIVFNEVCNFRLVFDDQNSFLTRCFHEYALLRCIRFLTLVRPQHTPIVLQEY